MQIYPCMHQDEFTLVSHPFKLLPKKRPNLIHRSAAPSALAWQAPKPIGWARLRQCGLALTSPSAVALEAWQLPAPRRSHSGVLSRVSAKTTSVSAQRFRGSIALADTIGTLRMPYVDPGHHLEQFPGHMTGTPACA